jgi:predicted RND superfamily exporter protein
MARPLSLVDGMKFIRQSYYGGDSTNYRLPNSFDLAFLSSYLNLRPVAGAKGGDGVKSGDPLKAGDGQAAGGGQQSGEGGKADAEANKMSLTGLLRSFVDSNMQQARISVNMADVGSKRLPLLLQDLQKKSAALFDSTRYRVEFTGTSVTYLEGSNFIIKGLKDSIIWAFVLIAGCMLYLFRSLRILVCSLVPNVIPLIITAGIMGWIGVRLKPSTVIIFSIALGIAIDVTIRFLVNYKQELAREGGVSPDQAVIDTIYKTGISIIYTSLVLIAGFVIFCFSGFGGIQALGWLTSLTLVIATVTNLVLLPVLLLSFTRKK